MPIYLPRHFEGDLSAARQLMCERPFATLITADGDDPWISHVPVLYQPGEQEDELGSLLFHLARPNPHNAVLLQGESTLVFHGPDAYISPNDYAEPQQHVPTWNFATVHARVRAIPLEGEEALVAMRQQVKAFEEDATQPWQLDESDARLMGMFRGISVYRLQITRLTTKFKLSQNRNAEDQRRVRLKTTPPAPWGRTCGEWMQHLQIGTANPAD
ncbi:FMN-binding negative transcriptional regulator [Leeia aquatica]|uniref:FMN-binding negative transcriptional regulator n=1 Tax=Leeia aquatica TaxID=2725557 RepID=A0A847SBB9_9NEIS|nr:FMN-binding negative transcriptional regulator [Leeia aquatica]NLR74639.1 FMN-binding negative transcriptional regulator [Leeia aquatica]